MEVGEVEVSEMEVSEVEVGGVEVSEVEVSEIDVIEFLTSDFQPLTSKFPLHRNIFLLFYSFCIKIRNSIFSFP